jgi:uncharacterized protein (TIGR03083 family)
MTEGDSALVPVGPVFLVDLFPRLHAELSGLLRGLRADDWARPTACAQWSVKDIAAHLLDTALRRLSHGRDGFALAPDHKIAAYAELVGYLNRLNAEWVTAARRLSPPVLLDLIDLTEPQLHAFLRSLDPHGPAAFAVAWAGEETSPNWFDIGREYTERWLHQQQIREAVGAPGLDSRAWLRPALEIFVRALPFSYRHLDAKVGESVRFEIRGDAGGVWTLHRLDGGWRLFVGSDPGSAARVSLDQGAAWKLFSKGLSPDEARRSIRIDGDSRLGQPALGTLAVMA